MLSRYYFDIRDGSDLYPDEEGMNLPNQIAAAVEAAQIPGRHGEGYPSIRSTARHGG
jgi:hypothetical protein